MNKSKAKSTAERQRQRTADLRAQGWRLWGVWLPSDLIDRLSALLGEGETRADLIERLVSMAERRRKSR